MSEILLKPKTLPAKIRSQITHAQRQGSLHSLPTEFEIVQQDGIAFILRMVINLDRKEQAQKKQADFNPFLPYEEDLYVTDISDTHVCLLNKYNVVEEHLLIVTRTFVEQQDLLNYADFLAVWAILSEIDGLVFYNSGPIAGASVRHKHLQLVPRDLAPHQGIPIESVLKHAEFEETIGIVRAFPFSHGYIKLTPSDSLTGATERSVDSYQQLLTALVPRSPYNLLMTREWMLIVPRSQASYQDIAVNSLGFAGAMLVRNQQQLELVKADQPLNILKEVGIKDVRF
ncbi:DUF4922 domain-containing protein [Gloeocapsa sp. PCC 73106]|uniref:ATP adenylyltransferase family protein n=1 Tax=Gloeocapsa sp. PCC 73106 TaxID=102232 RepID=UPI0002ACBB0D|nr:DUF4922 domain-containing protein [Gloeocapsa sp. PCC 73106]ELR98493.1 ATP adenylyltransferase (5',5'''-P-1,P-4-tetraphosphate phosphorylase II) [Gloeocapsa sp. PCC 73106]